MTDQNGNETSKQQFEWYHDPDTGEFFDAKGVGLKCFFDPDTRQFVDSNGIPYKFRKVSQAAQGKFYLALEKKYKPKIPVQALDIGDGDYSYESNPNDAAYQEALRNYETFFSMALSEYQIAQSLKFDMPPFEDWSEDLQFLYGFETDMDSPLERFAKPFFYLSHTMDDTEFTILRHLVMGQELPTVNEVHDAMVRFPGDGQ